MPSRLSNVQAGHFEVPTNTTQMRVTFRYNSGASYDCAVDGSSVGFIERARVYPGQPTSIKVPAHDNYLISSGDAVGKTAFGVSLPL